MSPPLEIRTGRRPFQMTVMASGLISGSVGLLNPNARSNAILAAFPTWFIYVYYLSLTVWCGLTLATLARALPTTVEPERLRLRLFLERAGLYGMGYTCVAYGIAAFSFVGMSALGPALFVGMFGAAAGIRIIEIHVDLKKLGRALADPRPADPVPLADPGRGA